MHLPQRERRARGIIRQRRHVAQKFDLVQGARQGTRVPPETDHKLLLRRGAILQKLEEHAAHDIAKLVESHHLRIHLRIITSNEAAVVDKDGHRQREDELRPRHIHHYIDKEFFERPRGARGAKIRENVSEQINGTAARTAKETKEKVRPHNRPKRQNRKSRGHVRDTHKVALLEIMGHLSVSIERVTQASHISSRVEASPGMVVRRTFLVLVLDHRLAHRAHRKDYCRIKHCTQRSLEGTRPRAKIQGFPRLDSLANCPRH